MQDEHLDEIVVEDEQGNEKKLLVEAMFDMEDETYALVRDQNDTLLMHVEYEKGEQYLVPIQDPEIKQSVIDAYYVAMDAQSDENNNRAE